MSKSDIWMPIYIGDYLSDTMRLTTLQHGAYFLLLLEYWKHGPLPNDMSELAAISKMDKRAWEKEVWPTLKRFFSVQDDGLLHQKRTDKERANADDRKTKRTAAANARWKGKGKKNTSNEDAKADANASALDMQDGCKQDAPRASCASALPSPSPSSLRSETLASLVPPNPHRDDRQDQTAEFDEFWSAYPRHVGKDAARKAHTKARTRATQAEIMLGLSRQVAAWPDRKSDRAQFIPYPASWLNSGGWQDDPSASAAAAPPQPQRNHVRPAIWDAVPDYPGV